jgi:hypothetical protein
VSSFNLVHQNRNLLPLKLGSVVNFALPQIRAAYVSDGVMNDKTYSEDNESAFELLATKKPRLQPNLCTTKTNTGVGCATFISILPAPSMQFA